MEKQSKFVKVKTINGFIYVDVSHISSLRLDPTGFILMMKNRKEHFISNDNEDLFKRIKSL